MDLAQKRAYNRAWYHAHRDQCVQAQAEYRRKNREKCRQSTLRHREKNLTVIKRKEVARNWRLTGIINPDGSPFELVDYDRLYQTQQGRCAGCKKHSLELLTRLSADHDHTTKIIRGLLCTKCNLVLRNAFDSLETLQNLINYLAKDI